jgi:hypothetical protein
MGKDVIEFRVVCRQNKRTNQKSFNIPTELLDKFETGKKYTVQVKEAD